MIARVKQAADRTASPSGEDDVSTREEAEESICSTSLLSETSSAKMKRHRRKASRAWGKNANASSGGNASASSSLCSSMNSSARSLQSSFSSRQSSTTSGGLDALQEHIVEDLKEELFALSLKTQDALNESYAEVDELRRKNEVSLKVLHDMEAEHRSLLDEKRNWERQSLASSAARDYKVRSVGRRGSGPGIVVTSGGANYKSGNIKMAAPAPTSDFFEQLPASTGSSAGDAPAARDRPSPKRIPSFLNRFSSTPARENDANQDQAAIRNVSVRRQSSISVLSSDDDDNEDLMRSLSTFDIANDKGEQDQGLGRGWRSLRESFSTSARNLLANINSEGECSENDTGNQSNPRKRSPSSLEISLQNQLRHLLSERNLASKTLDAQLQEAISVENGLIKTQATQKDEIDALRLKISDLKLSRNLAKSKAQDEIIELQTQIGNLIRSIDEKVSHLQSCEIEERAAPPAALTRAEN